MRIAQIDVGRNIIRIVAQITPRSDIRVTLIVLKRKNITQGSDIVVPQIILQRSIIKVVAQIAQGSGTIVAQIAQESGTIVAQIV